MKLRTFGRREVCFVLVRKTFVCLLVTQLFKEDRLLRVRVFFFDIFANILNLIIIRVSNMIDFARLEFVVDKVDIK